MAEQELVLGVKVYFKEPGGAPVITRKTIEELGVYAVYPYDETHAVLFKDDASKYNFTLVTKRSESSEKPTGASKSFFGECFIVGLQAGDIVDVEEDVPSFITTLVVGNN